MYVCQSVSWLTFLEKIDKYRDISKSGWDSFLTFIWQSSLDVYTPDPNIFKFLVNLSVCQLAYFLTEIKQILGYLPFFMRYLSEIFWETFPGCFYTSSKWFWIFCMSVSLLVGLLSYWNYTKIGKSPVLDKISLWNFLEWFLGYRYTCSK